LIGVPRENFAQLNAPGVKIVYETLHYRVKVLWLNHSLCCHLIGRSRRDYCVESSIDLDIDYWWF